MKSSMTGRWNAITSGLPLAFSDKKAIFIASKTYPSISVAENGILSEKQYFNLLTE